MNDRAPLLTPGIEQTLGPKTYWLFFSQKVDMAAIFFVFAIFLSFLGRTTVVPLEYKRIISIGSMTCLGITLISFFIALIATRLIYKNHSFCLTADSLKIKEGVFSKQEIAIPYRQIQSVDITRSLFQQVMGVSRLVIITAGHDDLETEHNEARGMMSVIDKELAEALQEELLRRADVQKIVQSNT